MDESLGCDPHDLLDEANTLSLSCALEVRKTAALIGKLRTCAQQALDAGFVELQQRMTKVADDLEHKLTDSEGT